MAQNKPSNITGESPSTPSTPSTPSSLSRKIHSSLSKLRWTFRRKTARTKPETAASSTSSSSRSLRSPTAEIKDKCRRFFNDMNARRCRRHSADFHYDALSYSKNFDDGNGNDDITGPEFRFRSFSSRLPRSPPPESDDEDESPIPLGFERKSTLSATTPAATEIIKIDGR